MDVAPACCERVITVAASDINDTKAWFSNDGVSLPVVPGGSDVHAGSPDINGGTINGTSMATPHVASFAAYLLGFDGTLTPAKIAAIIDAKAFDGILSGVREFFCSMLRV